MKCAGNTSGESVRIWKDIIVAYLKLLLWQLPGKIGGEIKNSILVVCKYSTFPII
jgi:hypothetical protein